MANIIGSFSIKRLSSGELIEGQICDAREDQDITESIFFTEIPLVTEMIAAKKEEKEPYHFFNMMAVCEDCNTSRKLNGITIRA